MASVLAWLHHSEEEKRQTHDFLQLFRETDTRDELGLGAIRDSLADLLFPGLSTIQTKARYFLLVPWCALELERRQTRSATAAIEMRKIEAHLIKALREGSSGTGVIGIDAGAAVKRLPSEVYWAGLRSFGISKETGSPGDYFRSLDSLYRAKEGRRSDADEQSDAKMGSWHSNLPDAPKDLFTTASLDLTKPEAEYLRDRITLVQHESLLAHLIRSEAQTDGFELAWEVPESGLANPTLRTWIDCAHGFSATMQGAAIFYNKLLATASGNEDRIAEYEEWWEEWVQHPTRASQTQRWSLDELWAVTQHSNIRRTAKNFVTRWVNIVQSGTFDEPTIRRLITERERQLKGSQARLGNPRALERWSGNAGTRQLDYRWPTARTVISDIQAGLHNA